MKKRSKEQHRFTNQGSGLFSRRNDANLVSVKRKIHRIGPQTIESRVAIAPVRSVDHFAEKEDVL